MPVALDVLPVTVIIPLYNRRDFVLGAVRSVVAQRPTPAQILVVDDGSTDGGGELLSASTDFAVQIIKQDNCGAGAARNTGLAAAHYDWVALLDSDDQWLPGHLAGLWEQRDSHVLICASAISSVSARVKGATGDKPLLLESPRDVVWPENRCVPSASLFLREAMLEAGGWSSRPLAEDLEAWIRLLSQGTGVVLPQVTTFWRQHSGQASVKQLEMLAAVGEVLRVHAAEPWNDVRLREAVEMRIAFDRMRLNGVAQLPAMREFAHQLGSAGGVGALYELLKHRHDERRYSRRFAGLADQEGHNFDSNTPAAFN